MKYYDAAVIIATAMYGSESVQVIPPGICVLNQGMFNPALDPNDFQGVLRWMLFAGYGVAIENNFIVISKKYMAGNIPYVVANSPYNDADTFKENIVRTLGMALFNEAPHNEPDVLG